MKEDAARTLTSVRVFFGALAGGVVLYGGVTAFLLLGTGYVAPSPDLAAALLPVAGVLTAVALVAAPFVEHRIRSSARAPVGEADRPAVLYRFLTASLVGFAVREGAALLALTAALITGHLEWGLGLAGLAVAGMALALPSESTLATYVRDVERRR